MERRNFFKAAGIASAAAMTGGAGIGKAFAQSAGTGMPRKFGYAILGLGKYATEVILPNFATSEHCEMVALISSSRSKAEFYARKYRLGPNSVYTYDNMAEIANNPAIDAVYVITPNATHRRFAEAAFRAGKHVMCEKPMAATVEDCRAMGAAAKKAGKQLMIGYRCHFDPLTREAIAMLKAGKVGKTQFVQTANMENQLPFRDQSYLKWRLTRKMAGSGSLGDLGIYGVNAARYLTNMDPVAVSGRELFRVNDVDGGMAWTLYYANGAVAEGGSSFGAGATNRFAVSGDKDYLEIQPGSSYYNNNAKLYSNSAGQDMVLSQPYFQKMTATQWGHQLDALPLSLKTGKPSAATWNEGLRDVQIISAIVRSAASGGRIVDVREGADWAQKLYGSEGLWSVLDRF